MRTWSGPLLGMVLTFSATSTALAEQPTRVEVILFPLGTALPVYIAQDVGLFADEGLEVTLTPTPDSPHLVENLANNKYQVALASLDNFIAYQEDQHVARYEPGKDLFVFMGGSPMNLPLVVRPEIESFDGLKGKTLAVDTPITAFALVLYRMMEHGGLAREDYELVNGGATYLRWQKLRAGEFDGTVLADGLSQQATSQGFNILANSLDILGAYQGTVLASNRKWAESNEQTLTRFTVAVLNALDWLYDPKNAAQAARILTRHLDTPPEDAQRAVARLKSEGGLTRDGSILPDGVEVVLDLRSEYGQPRKELGKPEEYIDLRYYEAAKQKRNH